MASNVEAAKTITRMGAMYTTPMREEPEMSMEEVFGEVIAAYSRLCCRAHKREYVAM